MIIRFIFLCSMFISAFCSYDPLLVVVLMVKNEEPVMEQTLAPLIKAGHQHFFVYDTGSTDNTVAFTREIFKRNKIKHGIIVQEPFIDFSTSRNRALDLTEFYFPKACFMLMIDAEWEVNNYEGLKQFCQKNKDSLQSYLIRILNNLCDYNVGRLIRCGTNKRFVGSVHEELTNVTQFLPRDIFIYWNCTKYGKQKSEARYKKDIQMLMKDLAIDPTSTRTVFYIAQTYSCLHDWENARIWYEKRIAMGGWHEELFLANYRLGLLYNIMGNWEKALHQLLYAYSMHPRRCEPLICIAERYKEMGNKPLCELFARKAIEIPYPDFNALALEKDAYLSQGKKLLEWATS